MIGIVFSRDRALQLEATLRSFLLHCQDPEHVRLNVLYLATSSMHARQYIELAKEYNRDLSIRFIPQLHFRSDLLKLLLPVEDHKFWQHIRPQIIKLSPRLGFLNGFGLVDRPLEYVLFLVDDNIFIRDFRLRSLEDSMNTNSDALGFSLRLGRNTTFCYAKNSNQRLPDFVQSQEGVLKFNWTTGELDFGYPLEVSSSIYRWRQTWLLLNRLAFRNPNTLENRMAASKRLYQLTHPDLLCFEHSTTFCNPINKVQTVWDNRSGSHPRYFIEKLADLFNEGFRIQVESYTDFTPNACHQEVDLVLEKRKGDVTGW